MLFPHRLSRPGLCANLSALLGQGRSLHRLKFPPEKRRKFASSVQPLPLVKQPRRRPSSLRFHLLSKPDHPSCRRRFVHSFLDGGVCAGSRRFPRSYRPRRTRVADFAALASHHAQEGWSAFQADGGEELRTLDSAPKPPVRDTLAKTCRADQKKGKKE